MLGVLALVAAALMTIAAGRVLDSIRPWRAALMASGIAAVGWLFSFFASFGVLHVPVTAVIATVVAVQYPTPTR